MSEQQTEAELIAWHQKVNEIRAARMAARATDTGPTFPRPACPIACTKCTIACGMATILLDKIEARMAARGIAPATSTTLH